MTSSTASYRSSFILARGRVGFLSLALFFSILPHCWAQQRVIWKEDFESDSVWDRWVVEGGVWEVGTPTGGPKKAFAGENCAATGLAGQYPSTADARLIRDTSFVVPEASDNPRLHFRQWFNLGQGDQGTVEVRVGQGAWKVVSQTNLWDGSGWSQGGVDLRNYAGQEVQIAFHFKATDAVSWGPDEGPGWYVDDVALVTGPTAVTNDFEAGWGDWSGYGWELGVPTGGPRKAHSGQYGVAVDLAGNYGVNVDTRLVSPPFLVPSAEQYPRFRFCHWYSFGQGDQGTVELRVGQTAWKVVSQTNVWDGSGWSQGVVDLRNYAGQEVQIAFHFKATDAVSWGPDEGPGWYVDDVALVTGPTVLPNDFEAGWGDWSADGASWEVGVPTSGPGKAYSGRNCAGTVLAGNYGVNVDTRLVSPPFLVPSAEQYPRFRFCHWYSFGQGDRGTVELRVGQTAWKVVSQTNVWDGSGWSQGLVDLRNYARQEVEIAFHFKAADAVSWGPDEGPGWYVDDVALVTGQPKFDNPEGFESGWGDWSAEGASWEVGTPASGPGKAHAGIDCAATVLKGNYGPTVDSRLITPAFIVPAAEANPALRFWHWYSFDLGDQGAVEIRLADGAWQRIAGPFAKASAAWLGGRIDLTPYSGQTVQIAFHFNATDAASWGPDEGPGWYLDDVSIRADILPSLGETNVIEEELLAIPLVAHGSDLVFSLCNGAPEGAAIDPLFGLFTWVPTECQGPGTYEITICVTSPNSALNPIDSKTFTVIVNESNAPPVLDPIGSKALKPNVPLTFAVTAFDPDCPTNALIFTLDPDAPAGASIDPKTGVFTWTPTAEQVTNTREITVRVTDNGSPPRSSTTTFSAVPEGTVPRLTARLTNEGNLWLTIEGMLAGVDYELAISKDLIEWKALRTIRSETGTFKHEDTDVGSEPLRFYRVRMP